MTQFVDFIDPVCRKKFYKLEHLRPVCKNLQTGILQTGSNSICLIPMLVTLSRPSSRITGTVDGTVLIMTISVHGDKFERISSNFSFEWTKFEFSENRNKFDSLCSNFELSIKRASDISPFHLLPRRPLGPLIFPSFYARSNRGKDLVNIK